MDWATGLEALFRWMHVFVGIIWIGLLYFFNFVNGPFAATMDGDTKKKVVPELMPRALYWFRWGAAWTWITGVVLLLLVYYHGGLALSSPTAEWGIGPIVMIAVTFLGVFLYDAIYNSPLKSNPRVAGAVSFLILAVVVFLMQLGTFGNFSYRGTLIHTAALFGTSMAFNVWFRIWPAQQKIINATKKGDKPDPAWPAVAGLRSKHNTYMSLPLIWGMLGQHTTFFSGGNLPIPGWIMWLLIILLGWHIIFHCYRRAGKVKGF